MTDYTALIDSMRAALLGTQSPTTQRAPDINLASSLKKRHVGFVADNQLESHMREYPGLVLIRLEDGAAANDLKETLTLAGINVIAVGFAREAKQTIMRMTLAVDANQPGLAECLTRLKEERNPVIAARALGQVNQGVKQALQITDPEARTSALSDILASILNAAPEESQSALARISRQKETEQARAHSFPL